jgi:hypothetical protein
MQEANLNFSQTFLEREKKPLLAKHENSITPVTSGNLE